MEIRISKPARMCHATDRPFAHNEEVVSLVRTEEGVLSREDYCREVWNEERSQGAVAVWVTRYVDPQVAEQTPPEVLSPLRQAFYEAALCEDRVRLAQAFLAAQLLRRQKAFRVLKESDDSQGEVRVTLYMDKGANRIIEVRDPNLTYAELEEGRMALLARLSELEQASSTEATATGG